MFRKLNVAGTRYEARAYVKTIVDSCVATFIIFNKSSLFNILYDLGQKSERPIPMRYKRL